jgi:SRSO17 transposase
MVERIPESNYQQLQHFISESEWDAKAVMKDVAENTNLSLEALTGEKGLILDERRERESGRKECWSSSPIHRECRESMQFPDWSLCGLESRG